jgi:tRNA(Ile)-lysidine synthase
MKSKTSLHRPWRTKFALRCLRQRPAAEEFVRSVRDSCRENDLIPVGVRVVIGVSGGPDSLALLNALHELSGPLKLGIIVAHLDHGLRRGSAADAAFVRTTAARLGLPFHGARTDVAKLASRRKCSVEEAGRLARYSFFYRTARNVGAGVVAVGHNRDDQAETVLMRLLRGASASGLGGIAPKRRLDDPLASIASGAGAARHTPASLASRSGPGRPVSLVRPLLDLSRAEIEGYLAARRIRPRRDPTNRNTGFLRNKIRHELIPLLERKYNPQLRALLARTARTLQEEDGLLESVAVASLLRIAEARRAGVALDARGLNGLPLPVRRRVLRLAAVRAGAVLNRLTRSHLDALVRLAGVETGETHIPGAVARRAGTRLVIG